MLTSTINRKYREVSMNKFQKVAVQIAKDDIKKRSSYRFREIRNACYAEFKANKVPIKKALGFKNWKKTLDI